MSKITDLYQKKREAYAAWRAIMDTAKAENRELTAEETATVDQAETDIDLCNEGVSAEQERERREAKLHQTSQEIEAARAMPTGTLQPEPQPPQPDNRSLSERIREMAAEGPGPPGHSQEYCGRQERSGRGQS